MINGDENEGFFYNGGANINQYEHYRKECGDSTKN